MTLATCVRRAADDLGRVGHAPDAARIDVEVLARHLLQWDAAEWLVRQREAPPAGFQEAFDAVVGRRRRDEPVAYITGIREFYGRPFLVTPDVLIPRPETETVVEDGLAALRDARAHGHETLRVADIGTGSGCLAVTLAAEAPDAEVMATDTSAAAIAVATRNAARHGVRDRVSFRNVSLLNGILDRFDLVVSNPPYVPETDRASLAPDVRDWEPASALFAGNDGLDVIRVLLPAATQALVASGSLVLEFGFGQADRIAALITATPDLALIRIRSDLAGIPRVAVARKRAASV